ncbi:MAG: hypothetical protein KKA31_06255, partial [Candidatus Margulisbacteria bacterium]|nr:hypothetical protein [Candidatus Margulisiibacteriota bacterium]
GAVGSGMRRIEAIAGQAAKVYILYKVKSLRDEVEELIGKYRLLETEKEQLGGKKFSETNIFEIEVTELDSLMKAVDNQEAAKVNKFLDHLIGRVDWLKERIAKSEKEIKNLKLANASQGAAKYIDEIIDLAGKKVLLKEFDNYSMDMLRSISDSVRQKQSSAVVVLASAFPERLIFLITVTDDLIKQGVSAKEIAQTFTGIVGGKGGGKENKAEGGGKDPGKIKEGFEAVKGLLG